MQFCPNPNCACHTQEVDGWYVKNGYYKPKNTGQKVPRYQCKACGKNFSSHTGKATEGQKKPRINKLLFELLVSGVSLRRASILLKVSGTTANRHFLFLAKRAEEEHYKHLATIQTGYVQVDELETFIHARAMPLSVPVVVRVRTGEILGFEVARMPAKGKLTAIGRDRYHWTVDERQGKFESMLLASRQCFKSGVVIGCDSHHSYPKWIRNTVPGAVLNQSKLVKKQPKGFTTTASRTVHDPLFAINNTFARMRHDMNRLGRKTWSTTKTLDGLKSHLWLYVAWKNGYKIW